MDQNVNSGWQIHVMSEAGLLYMCLTTVLGVRAVRMSQTGTSNMTEQLDMLDSGLLSAAVVLLAYCASGGLLVIKTTQLPPSAW